MKAYKWAAKDFAARWSKPEPSTQEQDSLSHAYEQGFERMRKEAADLARQLGNPGMARLIEAIFTCEVDPETGERLDKADL